VRITAEYESFDTMLSQSFNNGFLVVMVFEIPVAMLVKPSPNSVRKSVGMQVCVYINHCLAPTLACNFFQLFIFFS
jgi:hypothetical protein